MQRTGYIHIYGFFCESTFPVAIPFLICFHKIFPSTWLYGEVPLQFSGIIGKCWMIYALRLFFLSCFVNVLTCRCSCLNTIRMLKWHVGQSFSGFFWFYFVYFISLNVVRINQSSRNFDMMLKKWLLYVSKIVLCVCVWVWVYFIGTLNLLY